MATNLCRNANLISSAEARPKATSKTSKVRIGKMEFARSLATSFKSQMTDRGFAELPLLCAHSEIAGGVVSSNNDPWDRLLAAQAKLENLALISDDGKMNDFGISQFW